MDKFCHIARIFWLIVRKWIKKYIFFQVKTFLAKCSFGQVKCSFSSPTEKVSPKVGKNFTRRQMTKKIFFSKNCCSSKCSSGHAEVLILPLKVFWQKPQTFLLIDRIWLKNLHFCKISQVDPREKWNAILTTTPKHFDGRLELFFLISNKE